MGCYRICVGGVGNFPFRSRRVSQTRRKGPVTITGHGENAYGCLRSRSRPIPHFTDPSCHLRAVSRALAQFGKAVRADIDASTDGGDASTADVFTEISRATDKQLWLVEAHLCGSR